MSQKKLAEEGKHDEDSGHDGHNLSTQEAEKVDLYEFKDSLVNIRNSRTKKKEKSNSKTVRTKQ